MAGSNDWWTALLKNIFLRSATRVLPGSIAAQKTMTRRLSRIAQVAGFSKIPIPKLTTGFYSAYEDYDTELGIMLPSATVRAEKMTVHPLFVLIRDNYLLTVHSEEINRLLRFSRYAPPFFKRISEESLVDKDHPDPGTYHR